MQSFYSSCNELFGSTRLTNSSYVTLAMFTRFIADLHNRHRVVQPEALEGYRLPSAAQPLDRRSGEHRGLPARESATGQETDRRVCELAKKRNHLARFPQVRIRYYILPSINSSPDYITTYYCIIIIKNNK